MKKIEFTYENDDGEEVVVEFPAKYEVCGRCQGEGKHVNPSIDGHGITMDEWYGPDWDDESRDTYMSGGYDVTCHECKGERVVLFVDEDVVDKDPKYKDDWERYQKHQDDEDRYRAECEFERRMGC